MANCSSAWGAIEIFADSEETMKLIIKSFEKCEYCEYNTCLGGKDYYRLNGDTEFPYRLGTSFSGTGRWAYQDNIARHFIWCVNEKNLTEDEIKKLENANFYLVYDYTDYECGCEVFYRAIDQLVHLKSVPLKETVFNQGSYENVDLSWGNRLREEVEDERYLIGMLSDFEPDEVYDFLEKERESLEEYFEKSLKEYSKDEERWIPILKKYELGKAQTEGNSQ